MDSAAALLHLIFLAAMALILVGGLVSVLILWYVRGRDPHTGPVASYRSEPPDDLPPGAAGTLLDEHAEHHDVVATLLGLARHGAVEIAEIQEDGRRDFALILVAPDRVESRLERDLLGVIFRPDPLPLNEVRLSTIRPRFDAAVPQITRDLYQEMVDRSYFERSPKQTRLRWRRLAWAGIAGSIIGGIILALITDGWALLPAAAGVVVWLVMLRLARRMPQKTRHGAEAAAQWRAFRTYLADIRTYESLDEATALFDTYLSYAVAFRLEGQWLRDFERAGAPVPRWYHSAGEIFTLPHSGGAMWDAMTIGHYAGRLGGDGGDVDLPNMPNMPSGGMPDIDMQGASDAFSGGLQGASDGFADLLNSSGSIFDSIDFDF
ncbi:MAG: DUF2207 domain-containing protein [Chloroflexia bacterium]|nr:DUF2207 domain-containing protein [Chloroflexia bacterium]